MQEKKITSPEILEESVWSKTKYMVSKLGRLEKGGKIIGRNKQAQLAAAQVNDVLNKESSKLLRLLTNLVMQKHPEFPNMESHEEFLAACQIYTSFYDSLLSGTKLNPEDKAFIPSVVANASIVDLRVVWKNFLDYKLSTVYQTMNENNTVNSSLASAKAANPSNVISGFNHDSETMKTLKSNKLPMLLASLGSALGAFGWILKSDLMQNWLKSLVSAGGDVARAVDSNPIINSIGNGEGITQFLHRLYPNIDISPNAPIANFQKVLAQVGNGNPDEGLKSISGVMRHPDKIGAIKQMMASGKYHTMKELFNQAAGDPTSGRGGSWFETVKDAKMVVNIKQQIVKTLAVKTVGAAATAAGLGSFLAPLGIALVAAGVTTKLLRMKGQKSSRAQIMNDLLLSWELLPEADPGSQAMVKLGVVSKDQGLATSNTNSGEQGEVENGLPAHKRKFNSNHPDIEDAQIVGDDETPNVQANGLPTSPQQEPTNEPTAQNPEPQQEPQQQQQASETADIPPLLAKFAQDPFDINQRLAARQFMDTTKNSTYGPDIKAYNAVKALYDKTDKESQQQTNDFFSNFARQGGMSDDSDSNSTQPKTAPDRGSDGTSSVATPDSQTQSEPAAASSVLDRLDPEKNKNAEANIQAFGDTITSADKRNPQEIAEEIDFLKYAVNEIPKKAIMPKIRAMEALIKSNDTNSQLKAVRGFRQLSAYIKNLYVNALKNYSEDTANILKSDMTYTSAGGLKKKQSDSTPTPTPTTANSQQTQLPLNEAAYATPLFNAAEGKEDILLGTLTQTLPKLIKQLEAGTALTKEQQRYLLQKLNMGTYTQKAGRPDMEAGLVQKIIKELNKWLWVRIKDYQAYLKYLQKGTGGKKGSSPKQGQPEAEPINESTLNPFLKESVFLKEGFLNPFLLNPFLIG